MLHSRPRFGKKIRAIRRREGLTQAALARRLGISASYLNLIEHERRPLTAPLLVKVAQVLDLDLKTLDPGAQGELLDGLMEVFGDLLFDEAGLSRPEIAEFAATHPDVARAVLRLYHAYVATRRSTESLAERVVRGQDLSGPERVRLSTEQVSDFIQNRGNHFPDLEEAAESIRARAGLNGEDLFEALARYLHRRHGVRVRIGTVAEMQSLLRRFDPGSRELVLNEVLRRGSRNFQLAHQLGLLEHADLVERLASGDELTSEESRTLARIALANYLAAAVLMPYRPFLQAAREVRYDLDLLGHRFRASFEQVCHRLTTLHRKGEEGVPFHMVRVDIAGNISKKFSASGFRFPRFSGLCPLWNVHAAFLRPGMIRVQVSRMPDGQCLFSVARTVRKHWGGYHAPSVLHAIALGCDLDSARELVYADGMDLGNVRSAVPVGLTCRTCERMDCEARAFPPLQRPLRLDENRRAICFYAPTDEGA